MPKRLLSLLLALWTALFGAGQGSADAPEAAAPERTIVVGVAARPEGAIMEALRPALRERGYELRLVVYGNARRANRDLRKGRLDAHLIEHKPFFDADRAAHGGDLACARTLFYQPVMLYPGRLDRLDALPEGARIALPGDAAGEARALDLLAAEGLIRLEAAAGPYATLKDITDNPRHLIFLEAPEEQMLSLMSDADLVVLSASALRTAGLDPGRALATEQPTRDHLLRYAELLAVRQADLAGPKTAALLAVLDSPEAEAAMRREGVLPVDDQEARDYRAARPHRQEIAPNDRHAP